MSNNLPGSSHEAPSSEPPYSGSTSHVATAKRLQVPRACERCKRLRRGCSEYRPCKRCIASNVADQCHSPGDPHPANTPTAPDSAATLYDRLKELLPARVIDYCTETFFKRLYLTIPILTYDYVAKLRYACLSRESGLESLCLLAGMCGQVLLQTREPEDLYHEGAIPEINFNHGCLILETSVSIWQSLPRQSPVTIEMCLFTFFLYACEAVLSHHSRAFRFLRDTTTLLLLYQSEGADDMDLSAANHLFWVLLISERSHAIRYRRPITLQITKDTMGPAILDDNLLGFRSLAALFRAIDTSFIALLNQEVQPFGTSSEYLNYIETQINTALDSNSDFHDTQKANLRVTQLWLRVVIWKLRLHLGHLVEESYQHSLTFRYPIDIAKELMLSTRDLPISSFQVHGVGMTEKLFDIASALIDVLARVPVAPSSPHGMIVGTLPANDLSYLRDLIQRSPGGNTMYHDLLEKHIQQTLPDLVPRQVSAAPAALTHGY